MRILLVVLFSLLFSLSQAQLKWSTDENSYFIYELGGIYKYTLPAMTKELVVDSAALRYRGTSAAIKVRDFSFSVSKNKLLVFTNTQRVWRLDTRGDYYVLDLTNKQLQKLGTNLPASSLMFAKFSPDETKVAYVSKQNIYVEDLKDASVVQLTKDGTTKIINGTFDWAYEEEFGMRDGFRWSPNSKNIAFWQLDASHIKNFYILNNTDSIYPKLIEIEYPKVGEDPSSAKIGVVSVNNPVVKWMNIPGDAVQHYLIEMEWMSNEELIVQQLDRSQTSTKLMNVNVNTNNTSVLYEEASNAWIDAKRRWLDPTLVDWLWINIGKDFLWVSEKDGWRHIYNISRDGKKQKLITPEAFDIITVKAIDHRKGFVYFMASPDNATQSYLYRKKLDGTGKPERVSPKDQAGTHNYNISLNSSFAEHRFSNAKTPSITEWISLTDHAVVQKSKVSTLPAKKNVEFFQIVTDDKLVIDGWMAKPDNFDSTKKYPVVFLVYAEPAASTVRDQYDVNRSPFWYQGDLTSQGYIYISVDNRGTPSPKGAGWRKAIYQKIGIVNVDDQAKAARKILEWPFIDKNRVAVWGHSGGGSTVLNLMFRYPEIYKVGVSLSPVAWRPTYDNIYEERYMGLPKSNTQAYIDASALTHAKGLTGKLLVVHGTGDDNVHYQNTELLINELVKQGKQFSLMSYPNRKHGLREGPGTLQHLSTLTFNFLKENCPPGPR
jgi:dipeptidyl-peptidase-4